MRRDEFSIIDKYVKDTVNLVLDHILKDIVDYKEHILDNGGDDVAYGKMNAIDYAIATINEHKLKNNC